ncbi:MAG: ferredoxin family protein [Chloroflexi bacterium]|nr:ferredoxin family protein [Chloroflexota bacterium]
MPVLFSAEKGLLYADQERCKGCELCIEVCPVKVLEPSRQLNSRGVYPPTLKDGGHCTLCTLCESMCPDLAIFLLKDTTAKV